MQRRSLVNLTASTSALPLSDWPRSGMARSLTSAFTVRSRWHLAGIQQRVAPTNRDKAERHDDVMMVSKQAGRCNRHLKERSTWNDDGRATPPSPLCMCPNSSPTRPSKCSTAFSQVSEEETGIESGRNNDQSRPAPAQNRFQQRPLNCAGMFRRHSLGICHQLPS